MLVFTIGDIIGILFLLCVTGYALYVFVYGAWLDHKESKPYRNKDAEAAKKKEKQAVKKSGDGDRIALVVLIAIIAAVLVYNNYFAKHWVVVYGWDNSNDVYSIDDTQKFKDAASCAAYVADLNTQANVLRYQCGYKCKKTSEKPLVVCEKWS